MLIIFDMLKQKLNEWTTNAKDRNILTFNDIYMRLTDLAISMYEWQGLPESVDERFLELTLLQFGVVLFVKDDVLDYCVMKTAAAGKLDIYNTPTDRQAYAVTGYNEKFDKDNSVLIFNNRLRMPSSLSLELYAERIADLQRTIDVNVAAQKTPIMLKCTEKQKQTMLRLYRDYTGNEPFIVAVKDGAAEDITALPTLAPYVADKINTLKHQLWNEAMTFIGIESANTDKAERLITDEVTSNLGTAEAERYVKLTARREAAKKINKMYGLNVSVDFRSNNTVLDTSENGKSQQNMTVGSFRGAERSLSSSEATSAQSQEGK
jgi:hypothetical protein